jgi:hypothetical protein
LSLAVKKFVIIAFTVIIFSSLSNAENKCNLPVSLKMVSQASPFKIQTIRPAFEFEAKIWKESIVRIIKMSIERGRKFIGPINFEYLIGQVNGINLCINTSSNAIVGSGTRTGSVYFSKENLVVVNLALLNELRNQPGAGLMMIHEFLGALGYPDQDYAISTYIYLKIHPEIVSNNDLVIVEKALDQYLRPIIILAGDGGASGGPGGGDPYAPEIKTLIIRSILSVKLNSDLLVQIIKEVFDVSLEPESPQIKIVKVEKKGLSWGILKDRIGIAYNPKYWESVRFDQESSDVLLERSEFVMNIANLVLLLNKHEGLNFKLATMK